VHALSGGTGSGLSSSLVPSLMEEYSSKILKSYSVMPALNRLYNNNLEIINTVLTIPYLIDYIHETFCMDNEALSRSLHLPSMTNKFFDNQNRLISFVMSDITACLRFITECQYLDTFISSFKLNSFSRNITLFSIQISGPIKRRSQKTFGKYGAVSTIALLSAWTCATN